MGEQGQQEARAEALRIIAQAGTLPAEDLARSSLAQLRRLAASVQAERDFRGSLGLVDEHQVGS